MYDMIYIFISRLTYIHQTTRSVWGGWEGTLLPSGVKHRHRNTTREPPAIWCDTDTEVLQAYIQNYTDCWGAEIFSFLAGWCIRWQGFPQLKPDKTAMYQISVLIFNLSDNKLITLFHLLDILTLSTTHMPNLLYQRKNIFCELLMYDYLNGIVIFYNCLIFNILRALTTVIPKGHYQLSNQKDINNCHAKRALSTVKPKGHYQLSNQRSLTTVIPKGH